MLIPSQKRKKRSLKKSSVRLLWLTATITNTTTSANATISTKWTDFVRNSEEFKTDLGLVTVGIPYESDKTIILISKYIDGIGRAVDNVRADSYKIGDVIE